MKMDLRKCLPKFANAAIMSKWFSCSHLQMGGLSIRYAFPSMFIEASAVYISLEFVKLPSLPLSVAMLAGWTGPRDDWTKILRIVYEMWILSIWRMKKDGFLASDHHSFRKICWVPNIISTFFFFFFFLRWVSLILDCPNVNICSWFLTCLAFFLELMEKWVGSSVCFSISG